MWINESTNEIYKLHSEIRSAFRNVSFPRNLTDELIAPFGILAVKQVLRPDVDHTKNVTEGTPVLKGDTWTQVWEVTEATAEEIAQRTEDQANSVRSQRNTLLSDTDWTQVADAPVDATAWATYRQALRDITDHANFPWLDDEDWPIKPE